MRQDYIDIGQRFAPANMLDQIEYAILLARRDRKILNTCGWIDRDTETLQDLKEKLEEKVRSMGHGTVGRPARQKALAELISRAKRWRMQAMAIGRNALKGEALVEMELLSRPTYSDPGLMAEIVEGLLGTTTRHQQAMSERGATEAFLEEGRQVLQGLKEVIRGLSSREASSSEGEAYDIEVDELCGRAWDALKKLNRSGRAAQLLLGNRMRSSEYNLDLLSKRKPELAETNEGERKPHGEDKTEDHG